MRLRSFLPATLNFFPVHLLGPDAGSVVDVVEVVELVVVVLPVVCSKNARLWPS